MISKIKKFFKKVFNQEDKDNIVNETRVINSESDVIIRTIGDTYFCDLLRSHINDGKLKNYNYIEDWISKNCGKQVSHEEFFDESRVYVNGVVPESIVKLKRVWKNRKYTTTDDSLQKYMAEENED